MKQMNRSQRAQLLRLIFTLSLILLFLILLIGILLKPEEENPTAIVKEIEEISEPVIEVYENVWILGKSEDELLLFLEGETVRLAIEEQLSVPTEQLGDVTRTDGVVTDVRVKNEKITGKVLSADATYIELEGYGRLPLADDYKGYRIYNRLSMCTIKDLTFGYPFADFVMEEGEICGVLLAREETMENIRVLVMSADYNSRLHEKVEIMADCDLVVQYGPEQHKEQRLLPKGERLCIEATSELFTGDRISFLPQVITGRIYLPEVTRKQKKTGYRGQMELLRAEDGIAVINQLPLEEYLYSVVPSEMPANYPKQALEAQAICARTYAYGKMQKAGYPKYGAHVDDSANYQVYNNIAEQATTTTAVKDTYGELLFTKEGKLAETYFYSTSCGMGSNAMVWKTEAAKELTYLKARHISKESMEQYVAAGEALVQEAAVMPENTEFDFDTYIQGKDSTDFEVSEGWYRWVYEVEAPDVAHMYEIMKKRYAVDEKLILTKVGKQYVSKEIQEFTEIWNIEVVKRGEGGYVDEFLLETDKATYKIISQANARCVLNDGVTKVKRQDGSEVSANSLIPSAFFTIFTSKNKECVVKYKLIGGGFGHGVGMSQNGAKSMASCGYLSDEILGFFYEGCVVRNIYDGEGN